MMYVPHLDHYYYLGSFACTEIEKQNSHGCSIVGFTITQQEHMQYTLCMEPTWCEIQCL